MAKPTEQKTEKSVLKKLLDKILSSKPISYTSKRDPSEIAKDIKSARKRGANKTEQDALKEGYAYFGKQKPKRVDTRTPLPETKPGEEYGRGWGEPANPDNLTSPTSSSIKKKLARNKTNTA